MTWSILARDEAGNFGIAIASRFFAVGALCMHSRAGVGVLSTQALMNPLYGPAGIELLAMGQAPVQVAAALVGGDAGRDQRQLHVLGVSGPGAAYTGSSCVDWCGQHVGADFSVAGNMLAGPQVVQATAQAYQMSQGMPLAERLLAALAAGEAAGGDKRGKQSAALRIQGAEVYPQLDMRVDDHADPIPELIRLYAVSLERFQPFVATLAKRGDPSGLLDRAQIEDSINRFHAARKGHTQ